MKLTTKGRNAVSTMLELSRSSELRSASDLASAIGTSQKYLEQLLAMLKKAELVEPVRGVAGGYRLAQSTTEIGVHQILSAVDSLDATVCGGSSDCQDGKECDMHQVWHLMNYKIAQAMEDLTLNNLVHLQQKSKSAPATKNNASMSGQAPIHIVE